MHTALLPLLTLGVLASTTSAQFTISEALINPPGNDNGYECIEIRGAANAPLTGYSLLAIEGDSVNAGIVDTVINLGTYRTGSNGLLLVRDSTANAIRPAPATATRVVADAAAFTPDIENGTITLVLGRGTAPARTTDLDTNNDGKLDNGIPNFTVVDAISWTDGGRSDHMYAASLGGYDIPNSSAFTPDAAYRIYDAQGRPFCWTAADVLTTTAGGPYLFDWIGGDYQGGLAQGIGPQGLSLGNANGSLNFCADAYAVSIANGGTQTMTLDAGAANAGGIALVLGSLGGTSPGIRLTSTVTLPLNFDPYLNLLLNAPNTLITPSVATLDAAGRLTTRFRVPANAPITLGMTFHHAAVVFDRGFTRFVMASTPTTLFVQS